MSRSARAQEIRGLFRKLHVWERYGERAPNKPLLALWAIGRCINGHERLVPFPIVDEEVGELMREFGPPRARIHSEYAFWRLRNDEVWEVAGDDKVGVTGSGDPHRQDLFNPEVRGGFLEAIYVEFCKDPSLAQEIAHSLVRAHFPSTRQGEVLEATRIEPTQITLRRSHQFPRDSEFRQVVLQAYSFGCALCGFAVRLERDTRGSHTPIGLDAAHIMWHQARGPAMVQNGMALCALHHRLFDYGAFTLSSSLTVVVADSIRGAGADEWLWRFEGQPLPETVRPDSRPDPQFLDWHLRNVFRGISQGGQVPRAL